MRRAAVLMAAALAVVGIGVGAVAQQPGPLTPPTSTAQAKGASPVTAPPPGPPAGTPQLTRQDADAWLDGFMPYALNQGDIAGAVVVIVRNGQIVTQRGFGYADLARRTPVVPDQTLFRPGSVSKLITWTAVMQLVEQGKLDLDTDVNRYLDFEIPARDGQPITLRNIMTHTAGFEEQIKDLIGHASDHVIPFDELVKRWIPHRIFAPGTTPAYSNYATSLAGYIVQRVSGEPFDDYVERHIFQPLGMNHSSFRQPLPPALRPLMATGYLRASTGPVPFEIVGPAPAGSLSSTGTDMARFMIAHLNGGELDGQRILRPETAQMMHRTALNVIPHLDRMLLGFFETNINGREVIAHLGDTGAFHTSLHLFIDENTGLYASFSSSGKEGAVNGVRVSLFEQFANRYFPNRTPPAASTVSAEDAAQHAQMMAGNWTASRRADSTFLNLSELLGQTSISVGPDGKLITPPGLGLTGHPADWVEVEPFLWQDRNSFQKLAAVVEDGEVKRFSFSIASPFEVFERPAPFKNAALVLPLLQIALLILVLTALLWPIRWRVRRHYKVPFALTGRDKLAYRLSRGAALLILLVTVGWVMVLQTMLGSLSNLGSGFDGVLLTIQLLTFIAFVGGLAVFVWYAWTVWRGGRRWTGKVWSLALVFAGVMAVWVGLAFHLIDFGTDY